MGVVAKMFVSVAEQAGDGTANYKLSAVCRGDENKTWAAATPAGNATLTHPALDELWAARLADPSVPLEVLVTVTPDPDGEFVMESCDFAYAGCSVKFRRNASGPPYGQTMQMTVNAQAATAQLRQAFADGLLAGKAPQVRIDVARV